MRTPRRAARNRICTTSLWAIGQYHFDAEPPTVDDVAYEIDGLALMIAKKVEESVALAPAAAKMHVRQEQRAIPSRPCWQPVVVYLKAESHASDIDQIVSQIHDGRTGAPTNAPIPTVRRPRSDAALRRLQSKEGNAVDLRSLPRRDKPERCHSLARLRQFLRHADAVSLLLQLPGILARPNH